MAKRAAKRNGRQALEIPPNGEAAGFAAIAFRGQKRSKTLQPVSLPLRFVSLHFAATPGAGARPYSTGAGLTANGPGGGGAAALSSRGLSAPVTRPVSETQPTGAGTVGPLPGPATTWTTR